MEVLALCLVLVAFPAVLLAQPNCTRLGFNVAPSPGTELPHCIRDEQQCCTANYIERVEATVTEKLQVFLAEEFDEVIEDYLDDIENLIDYFTEDFPEDLLEQLPGAIFINRSDPLIRQVVQDLIENYEIPDGDRFNVRTFFNSLLDSLREVLVRQFGTSSSVQQCIRRVINSEINQNVVNDIADQIQEIRRSLTSLRRIGSFLERERRRLRNISPLQQCVTAFINLAFCRRCVQRTPPLCLNTCNALVRGCYSPYYTALNRDYDQLWTVVRNIITVVNSTVQNILTGESAIIDIEQLTAEVFSECGLSVSGINTGRRRRDDGREENTGGTNANTNSTRGANSTNEGGGEERSGVNDGVDGNNDGTGGTRERSDGAFSGESSRNDTSSREDTTGDSDSSMKAREKDAMFIPFGLVDDAVALTGAFQYGRRGLNLCLDALVEDSGFCGKEDMDNNTSFCFNEYVCTARCNCWDGESIRRNDTEDFELNDIEGQDQNPVLDISQQVLENVVNAIGDPVAAFLASEEFTSVAPSGIQEEERSSSARAVISIATFLLSSLMALV